MYHVHSEEWNRQMHPITVIYTAAIQAPNIFLLIGGRRYRLQAKGGAVNCQGARKLLPFRKQQLAPAASRRGFNFANSFHSTLTAKGRSNAFGPATNRGLCRGRAALTLAPCRSDKHQCLLSSGQNKVHSCFLPHRLARCFVLITSFHPACGKASRCDD